MFHKIKSKENEFFLNYMLHIFFRMLLVFFGLETYGHKSRAYRLQNTPGKHRQIQRIIRGQKW